MNLLALLGFVVFAAETIISPVPETQVTATIEQPEVSFGQLLPVIPDTGEEILGVQAPTPTPQPIRQARKNAFTIAVIGDSMVDTLGPDVPHLKNRLSKLYPGVSFTILNYGIGATNIDSGLERINRAYNYEGRSLPALSEAHPDIVVVESFAYNPYPFDEGALDRHWMKLGEFVSTLKGIVPEARLVVASTIAPNSTVFADGIAGLSFDAEGKKRKVEEIKRYLDNVVKFAKGQGLPLADAFHASLDGHGEGKLIYINPGDHLHYSDTGRALFGSKVAETIVANKLLE